MLSNCPIVPLGEVCRFVGGGTPARSREDYFAGHIPWATVKDFKSFRIVDTEEHITQEAVDSSAANIVAPGTVLLVTRVGLGKVAIADRRIAINQDIKGLTPRGDVLPDYLFWFLLSRADDLERRGVGATVKGVTLQDVRSIRMPLPPELTQRRIVDLLSRAESIVRMRREAEQKAKEIIPALFLDMFGDPATNPKGWTEISLGQVIADFRYGSSQKSSVVGDPVLRIPNVIRGNVDIRDLKFLEVAEADRKRYSLVRGDILFVRTNGNPDYVGRCAVFEPPDDQHWLYASYLIRGRPLSAVVDPYFLQVQLSSVEGRRRLRERARTAAGQYNINIEGLRSIPICLPSLTLQRSFASVVRRVRALSDGSTTASAIAEMSFNSLLARFFGEAV